MNICELLDITPLIDRDTVEICSDHAPKPDTTIFGDLHISDDCGLREKDGLGVDVGGLVLERQDERVHKNPFGKI